MMMHFNHDEIQASENESGQFTKSLADSSETFSK